jgi:hypothetical protein
MELASTNVQNRAFLPPVKPKESPPPSRDDPAALGSSRGTTTTFRTGEYETARDHAHKTGEERPNMNTLQVLEDRAEAGAHENGAAPFDQIKNRSDAEMVFQLQEERDEASRLENVITNFDEPECIRRADDRAKCEPISPKPTDAASHFILGATSVAFTFFWTIQALLSEVFENIQESSVISGITSFIIGLFLALAIDDSEKNSDGGGRSWWAIIAGILLGLGLGIVRYSFAADDIAKMSSIGLFVAEVGIVLLLHILTSKRRAAREKHLRTSGAVELCDRRLSISERTMSEHKAKKDACEHKIETILEKIKAREHAHHQVDRLADAARKATREGYYAGIADNIEKNRK